MKNLLFIIFAFISSFSYGQINFNSGIYLSIDNGLSHNGVTSMIEDSKGYLWIGTYDGLNRYNGYDISVYKNTPNKTILISNRIRSLEEDENERLWIGTDRGINVYDENTEKFSPVDNSHLKINIYPVFRKIYYDKVNKQMICLSERNGLFIYDNNLRLIRHIKLTTEDIKKIEFTDIMALDNQNLFISSNRGPYIYNTNTRKVIYFSSLKSLNINSSSLYKNKYIVCGLSKGLILLSINKEQSKFIIKKASNIILNEKQVLATYYNKKTGLLLGTFDSKVYQTNDVLSFFKKNQYYENFDVNKKKARVSAFFYNSKLTAICTFDAGLCIYNHKYFQKYHLHHMSGLVENVIVLDSTKVILTQIEKQYIYDTKTDSIKPLNWNFNTNNYHFLNVSENEIFIHTHFHRQNFYYIYNKKTERLTPLKIKIHVESSLDFNKLYYIVKGKYKNYWFASGGKVYEVHINKNHVLDDIKSVLNMNIFQKGRLGRIRTLYRDSLTNDIFVGTSTQGLFQIKILSEKLGDVKITNYRHSSSDTTSLSSNFVTSILRTPDSTLWIGTEVGGLCKATKDMKFVRLCENNGLSNNVVKNLLYKDGYIWASTNNGLNKININTNIITKYNKSDGLPINGFIYPAANLSSGKLVFISANKVLCFNPKDILDDEPLPILRFDKINIFNDKYYPKETIIDNIKDLKLKYNENIFSIYVNSLHFLNPTNHYIKYKMSPIMEEWITIPSNKRVISFNGLPPGSYICEVKASNGFGKWTNPRELKIVIRPPFWKTKVAYLFYIIFILSIIYVVLRYLFRFQELRHQLEIENIEKKNIEKSGEEKFNYLSNISHELKTQLTLISAPIELLIDQFKHNPKIFKELNIVKRQSEKMLSSVNQVISFKKDSVNKLEKKLSTFSFNDFLDGIIPDFIFTAESQHKIFKIEADSQDVIHVEADRVMLEQILNNLINNAFKYTDISDTITLEFKAENSNLYISVVDTGIGIAEKDLPYIFDRYFRSQTKDNNSIEGTGIGLTFVKNLVEKHNGSITVKSELNKGTTFKVILPIVKVKVEQNIIETPIVKEEYNLESSDNYKNNTIYIVEDNYDMRTMLYDVLSSYYKIKIFEEAESCITALNDFWPDLIISDVQMPGMSGFELCKYVKSDINLTQIPFILLTALSKENTKFHGYKIGADAYIIKPFNFKFLMVRINSLLDNRKKMKDRVQTGLPLKKDDTLHKKIDNDFFNSFLELIKSNYSDSNLDIDRFAVELGLNRTNYYKKVKKITGQSPYEFIKNYRLEKAAEMLSTNKTQVNEVFLSTGFKSRSHFSKLFKEKFGVPPGQYYESKFTQKHK